MSLRSKSRENRTCHGGIALVSTLAFVSLLTILVVAFVSIVSGDRRATWNYAQALQAEQIAFSGLDMVVSQLRAQIADTRFSTTNTSGTNVLYVPASAAYVSPQRMAPSALGPVVAVSGTNLYAGAKDFASPGSATTSPSLNGRSVSVARWYKPQLLPSPTMSLFSQNAPKWILLTRDGPAPFSRGTTPSRAGGSAVAGRYAYVVYDTSGLLDANVAGYPSAASAAATTNKGLMPWADLSQLSSQVGAQDADALVRWRNTSNAVAYPSYVSGFGATNGFLNVAAGDTAFLTRQELIRYAQTQRPALTNALPYLTTFSREANGPTWSPTANLGAGYNYQANALAAGATNPAAFQPRVTAGGWTRFNGIAALKGEPLVKYRFPLDKLALLESVGTTYTASDYGNNKDNIKTDIQKYFGLDLVADSSGYYRHWSYPTTNTAYRHTAGRILTLAQVAALNPGREPDFFELLQAGILSGSLGKGGRADAVAGSGFYALYPPTNPWIDPDTRADYQLVRIGANVIDQWSAGNYPTTITFDNEDFYGVKDLPYINKVFVRVNGSGTSWYDNIPTPPLDYYLYFELWNPHQQGVTPAGSPTQFRIIPMPATAASPDTYQLGMSDGIGHFWFYTPGSGGWSSPATSVSKKFASLTSPSGGTIAFSVTSSGPSSYREPAVIPSANPAWTGGPKYAVLSLGQVSSFPVGIKASTGTLVWPFAVPPGGSYPQNSALFNFNAVFLLQFQDAAGGWHTYSTFEGLADPAFQNGYCSLVSCVPMRPTDTVNVAAFVKSDPRTGRFGPAESFPAYHIAGASSLSEGSPLTPGIGGLVSRVWGNIAPFIGRGHTAYATPYRPDMWAVNDPNVAIQPAGVSYTVTSGDGIPFYKDVDGARRVGDAGYAYPNASPYFNGGSDRSARPVFLGRSFHSVGDLGYAFRDMPWKTLDFFSANSADAALLDFFTLSDGPVLAGRVNPNAAPAPVLAALLSGAMANESGANAALSPSSASRIALALVSTVSAAPFAGRADLVTAFMNNGAVGGFSSLKAEREAVVRALAESSNTRTWNLLCDIVAQAGNYPATAKSLDDFVVSGERRYWLHIAIDRYTGQVVDKRIEQVSE